MFFFPTHLVYFLLRSLYGMYYTIKRVHSSLPEVSLMMLPLFTLFLFSLRRRKRERQRGCFFSRVSRRKVSLPLFLRERNEEKFLGLSSSSIALPKTTTQLNSPLSSATILIPQNFFFLFVRAKAPPPQKQNKTNNTFYEHV